MSGLSAFYLTNQGRKMKLKKDQLSTKWIGKIFSLFPDSILLISEDGDVETPDDSGFFTSLIEYFNYEVQGQSILTSPSSTDVTTSALPYQKPTKGISKKIPYRTSVNIGQPSKPPGVVAQSKDEWTRNIEIHRFSDGELRKFSNFPIILTPQTASITHISSLLSHEAFQGKVVVLLDNDNLQIPDTSASRGKFICG